MGITKRPATGWLAASRFSVWAYARLGRFGRMGPRRRPPAAPLAPAGALFVPPEAVAPPPAPAPAPPVSPPASPASRRRASCARSALTCFVCTAAVACRSDEQRARGVEGSDRVARPQWRYVAGTRDAARGPACSPWRPHGAPAARGPHLSPLPFPVPRFSLPPDCRPAGHAARRPPPAPPCCFVPPPCSLRFPSADLAPPPRRDPLCGPC